MRRFFKRRSGQPRKNRAPLGRRLWSMESLEDRRMLAIDLMGAPDWVEQGPGSITNGTALVSPNNEVVGAVESIAAHPMDANIAYAAAVNGGIWKTTNALAPTPTWVPQTDQYPSLSVGQIAFSPLDPTGNTIFAATGQFSNGFDGGNAAGILRTTDGGATWSQLGAETLRGFHIKALIPTAIDVDPGPNLGQVVLGSWK